MRHAGSCRSISSPWPGSLFVGLLLESISYRCLQKLLLWVSASVADFRFERNIFVSVDNPAYQCCWCLHYCGQEFWFGFFVSHNCAQMLQAITHFKPLVIHFDISFDALTFIHHYFFQHVSPCQHTLVENNIELHAIHIKMKRSLIPVMGKVFIWKSTESALKLYVQALVG